jgi:hypothetical protein
VDGKPAPVVFRPRSPGATAIWAVFAVGFALIAAVFVLTNLGLQLRPSPWLVGALVVGVVIALFNRARPLGLDRAGLRVGSADDGHVLPWSTMTGVVIVPRSLIQPERIRIRMIDSSHVPGAWARRRWGVRVRPGPELELPLGYGLAGAEIADKIRGFVDAYG